VNDYQAINTNRKLHAVAVEFDRRGIGLGLARSLQKRGNTVISTLRDPTREHAGMQNILATELNVDSLESIKAWVQSLRDRNIQHIDVSEWWKGQLMVMHGEH